jgi:hypothetical protein
MPTKTAKTRKPAKAAKPAKTTKSAKATKTAKATKATKATKTAKTGKPMKATRPGRFSPPVIAALDASSIIGIRAGKRSDHRFIGVWPIVVNGRLFARSWTMKPDGWYHTFLDDPIGTLQIGERQIAIRAQRVRGSRLLAAIEQAYAVKYATPASKKYVRGFRTARRRATTTEFVPR